MRRIRSLRHYPSADSPNDAADVKTLARGIYEAPADTPNSGLVAFAYLTRRFGPPPLLGDTGKHMGEWVLTTPDPEVWLYVHPGPGKLWLAFGCGVGPTLSAWWESRWQTYHDQRIAACARHNPEIVERWLPNGKPVLTEDGSEWVTFGGDDDTNPDPRWVAAHEEVGKAPRLHSDRWWEGPPEQVRINTALAKTLRSLLHPVRVRDHRFNILGVV